MEYKAPLNNYISHVTYIRYFSFPLQSQEISQIMLLPMWICFVYHK